MPVIIRDCFLAPPWFFYFWWLAALIFDFEFVWHRDVLNSMFETRMHEWTEKKSGPGDAKYSDITK